MSTVSKPPTPFFDFEICLIYMSINTKTRPPHCRVYNDFNLHLPNGLSYHYHLDESISSFRGIWCTVSFLFYS